MQIPKWMREMQTSLFTLLLHVCVFRCRHVNRRIPKQWTRKRNGFCLIFTPHFHWKLAWSEHKHDLEIYLFEPVVPHLVLLSTGPPAPILSLQCILLDMKENTGLRWRKLLLNSNVSVLFYVNRSTAPVSGFTSWDSWSAIPFRQ